ncbi:MAG: hypothetical protein J6Q15_01120, partial [Clostridia bacterium]|nr:hypothetical protein [Clostridia bacterium]
MNSVYKFLEASKLNNLCVTGTKIGEQAFLISKLDSPVFFVVGDSETAYKTQQQLIALGKRCALIDGVDNPYIISKYQSQDNNINILNVLYSLLRNDLDVVVITPQVINLKLGKADKFKTNILEFEVDKVVDVQALGSRLIELGYNRVDNVQQIGDFAIRGEVIDIFAPNHTYPIRINLFDDLVENIIYFDNINLSTISKLQQANICPMKDCILTNDEYDLCVKELGKIAEKTTDDRLYDLLSQFEINKKISNEYLKLLGVEFDTIFNYKPGARIVLSNPLHIKTKLEQTVNEQTKLIEGMFKSSDVKTALIPLCNMEFGENIIVFDSLGNYKSKNTIDLPTKNLSSYLYKTELIKFELASVRNKQIQLCLDNEYTFNSIKNLLTANGVGVFTDLKSNGIVLTQNKLPYNVCFVNDDIWYIGSTNFAHKKIANTNKTAKIKFLPKAGEYVVHEIHGIGRCEGVATLNVMGADKDFFKVVYKNDDVLYVPTENTNSLSLYMSDGGQANLNRLGGKEFASNKAKTQSAIEDMAKELLVLYSKRKNSKGYKYSDDNYLCTEFDNAFEGLNMPYSLENEQSVLGAILLDPACMTDDVVATLRPEHFYLPQHKAIFTAMVAMDAINKPLDFVTILEQLRSDGLYEQAGGKEYLTQLAQIVPSIANVHVYAQAVI